MSPFSTIKPIKKPRIGLYSIGLHAYWEQFAGLKERLANYGQFIEKRMAAWGDVYNYGLVDTEAAGRQAGAWLHEKQVDLVFCHVATYATSSMVLPVHQICQAPAVFLNLQPPESIDYERSTTGDGLAHCVAGSVP